ncbi:MAG: class A beta-lactamase-related serine hydrolase, partial [Proteobacteria bacterium]|nr:class A beta-lactamase-related serine hydrolase [Pseudomonadota bacterium]
MRSNLNHVLAGAAAVGITGGLAAFSFNRSHRPEVESSAAAAAPLVQHEPETISQAPAGALRPLDKELQRVMQLVKFAGQGAVWRSTGETVAVECGADKEGRAITRDTVFDIASVSKQFTAVGILRLVESGKLDLEAKISDLLKNVPADKQDITVRQLLTHTSGLGADLPFGDPYNRDKLIGALLAKPTIAARGERFNYNNSNYFILADIIEQVSGKTFEDFIQ